MDRVSIHELSEDTLATDITTDTLYPAQKTRSTTTIQHWRSLARSGKGFPVKREHNMSYAEIASVDEHLNQHG